MKAYNRILGRTSDFVKAGVTVNIVTATTGGGTTGIIPANTDIAYVVGTDDSKQVTLPVPVANKELLILNTVINKDLLILPSAGTIKINGKVTTTITIQELIGVHLKAISTTEWILTTFDMPVGS